MGQGVKPENLTLDSKAVGVLPIVNHFLDRLHLEGLLDRFLPPPDARAKMPERRSLGVLVRNLIVNRVPLYSVCEWTGQISPELLGLHGDEVRLLNDDRVGRALDRLFDADRAALLTELVVGMIRTFRIALEELHNDSTTVTLQGEYAKADGRRVRGKQTLVITFGHNKDHRPDLKQLLWILTVSEDGGVPVHFRVADGNTEDSTSHVETWEALLKLVGKPGFLYVADCKLCTRESMVYLDEHGGRFITVLPRTRAENKQFKGWLQANTPAWEEVVRFEAGSAGGAPDIFHAVDSPVPDADGFRLIWYHSTQKAHRDAQVRQETIARAVRKLEELRARLEGPRCRFKTRHGVAAVADQILAETGAAEWLRYTIEEKPENKFRQEKRGRPGPKTRWRRNQKPRFQLKWEQIEEGLARARRTDGIFPLITNCRKMTHREVLIAYKRKQPFVEKRHDLLKNVLEIPPAFLKNAARLEAFLFLTYIALTVHALIERQLRLGMEQQHTESLPLYPEERECVAPTMARLLDVFGDLRRNVVRDAGTVVKVFPPELREIHTTTLALLGMSPRQYQDSWKAE
jgi:transposase